MVRKSRTYRYPGLQTNFDFDSQFAKLLRMTSLLLPPWEMVAILANTTPQRIPES
jgi:hypothetical protein